MVSNWKTSNITDLLKPNGIKIGPFGSQLKKELFVSNGDYKVYGQENVYAQNFKIGDRYMTRSHFDKLRSCELLPGDFVMSTMGTVGKCAIVPTYITRGIMDSHLIRLRFDEKVIDKTYLLQLFSPDIQFLKDQTDKLSVGGIMDGLSVKIVSSLTVEYPSSVEEQKAIVNVLSAADGMISSLEKLIAKKKEIKQGAMQELLTGKKRLPGFAGEWVHMELGQHGTLIKESINPQQYPTEYFWEYSMPAFDAERVPIKRKGTDMHSNRTMIAGQVLLFNKLNVRQKRVWLINQCQESAVCSSEFLPYQSDEINLRLLGQILFTDQVTLEFIGMSTGTSNSQKRITPDDFLGYKVYLPIDEKEQSALAEVFACMDNEIEALERELVKTRQIKQGMMQQLLTGKIRLV